MAIVYHAEMIDPLSLPSHLGKNLNWKKRQAYKIRQGNNNA